MRTHNEYVADAALQGIKLPTKMSDIEAEKPFSKEADDLLTQQMYEAQRRKMIDMKAQNGDL